MKRWITPILLALLFMIAVVLLMKGEDTKTLPQVTMEQKLDYHRARANLATAQQQLEASQKALQASVDIMSKVCGDRGLIADAKGDPECGQKAQPAAKGN